jgi:hypothetical protein
MVYVKGRSTSGIGIYKRELGLTDSPIRLSFKINHKDVHVDDFGPDVPANLHTNLAEVTVRMTLAHYDDYILRTCIRESMVSAGIVDGVCPPGGTPIGNGGELFSTTNYFISLNILPLSVQPWRFPACVLTQPLEYPIGSALTSPELVWRGIPYASLAPLESYRLPSLPGVIFNPHRGDILSYGAVLWSHILDE